MTHSPQPLRVSLRGTIALSLFAGINIGTASAQDTADCLCGAAQASATFIADVLDESVQQRRNAQRGNAQRGNAQRGNAQRGNSQRGNAQRRRQRGIARAHDPSTIVNHKDVYWTFTTGNGVSSMFSRDLVNWERGPAVFDSPPEWITDIVPTQRGHFWAPDIIQQDGQFWLYYSVSAFGKRTSAIALATATTLDPEDPDFGWTDKGIVVQTNDDSDHNAIDPSVVAGDDGTMWMAYGSFWSGIKLIELDPATGKRIAEDSPIHAIAHKEQIEAVTIYKHGDYYYQFVNWGWCCRGLESTYNIRVGRSREITGPYLDADGVDLAEGGGTLLLETEGRFIGPGHATILREGDRYLMSFHFYDGEARGQSKLGIRPITWNQDGWPEISGENIVRIDAAEQ